MTRDERLAEHAALEGPLLPILHAVQDAFGWVDPEAELTIAMALNLSSAEVHGVVNFYHDFRAEPDPRPEVELCPAEACKARGVEALVSAAEAAAGKRVRLSTGYRLGLCCVCRTRGLVMRSKRGSRWMIDKLERRSGWPGMRPRFGQTIERRRCLKITPKRP